MLPLSSLLRRRSGKHGDGVFTKVAIARGSEVIQFTGRVMPASAVTDDMRAMQIGPTEFLVEDPADDAIDNYINHSCEPNCGFVRGDLILIALRDIAAGEELLWDYSTSMNEPGWSLPCACGTATCRGKIQSHCDLSPAEKARLAPTTLAYLRPAK